MFSSPWWRSGQLDREKVRRLPGWQILILAMASLQAGGLLFAESEWIQVRSPHFTLVSNAGVEAAGEATLRFEQIRGAFRQALPAAKTDPGQPIVVLAVKDEESLRELLPQYWERPNSMKPAGVFLSGPERHYVALRLDIQGPIPYRTLYHEYFHLLLRINHPRLPLWLSEGLAEFYAHTRISEEGIVLGLPSQAHVSRLRSEKMLPLKTLFRVDRGSEHYNEAQKASIFYSQAWALTHYLMTAGRGEGTRSPIDELLGLLQQGVRRDQAVQMALGALPGLERSLAEYVAGDEFRFYTYPLGLGEPVDLKVSSLSPAEGLSIRAAFLVRNDRAGEAQELIYRALSVNPNEALAFESLGYLHYRAGRRQRAFDAFERAVNLGSASYLSHYLFADLASSEKHETDPARSRIESSLRQAIQLRPGFPYSYSALARYFLRENEQLVEALDLATEACRLEPANVRLLQTLGYSLLALDRLDEAKQVVARMGRVAASREDHEISERLARRIEGHAIEKPARWTHEYALETGNSNGNQPGGIPAGLIHEASGKFSSVHCEPPATLELTVQGEEGALNLIFWDYKLVEYIVPSRSDRFHPCRHLEGKNGTVRFFEDQEHGSRRLLGVMITQP